jgi:hypothetical protein
MKRMMLSGQSEDGQALTLVNPAYMTIQIAEISAQKDKTRTHITSLDPIRPAKVPYSWEAEAFDPSRETVMNIMPGILVPATPYSGTWPPCGLKRPA